MPREKIMASIDIGSHAVQMLLAKACADGRIEPVNEYVAVTRLGESLPETGLLSEKAMASTIQAAKEMQDIAMKEGAQGLIVTAGCIIREASNRSKFLLMCHQQLNIYPQLLSGKDEARLNFLGASTELPSGRPMLVLCVGVSNSQISFGSGDGIVSAVSLDIGAVKIEKLYSVGSAGGLLKQKAAQAHLKRELQPLFQEATDWLVSVKGKPETFVTGVIASSLAAMIKGQPIYDFRALNMTSGTRGDVFDQFKRLSKLKGRELLAVTGLDPELKEIMPAGLLTLNSMLEFFGVEDFRISSAGLKAGILKYFMDKP